MPAQASFLNAAIERKNSTGGEEYWLSDATTGTETYGNAPGVRTTIRSFVSGVLAGKVRSIDKIEAGKTTKLYKPNYGDDGRLLSSLNSTGLKTVYRYDNRGQKTSQELDGRVLWTRVFDQKGRVIEIQWSDGRKLSCSYGINQARTETMEDKSSTIVRQFDESGGLTHESLNVH